VSRGRRPKKGGKRKPQKSRIDAARLPVVPVGSPLAALARTLGEGGRPEWFDGGVERVLAGAGALTAARNGCELDQWVAELVGAQLYGALQAGRSLRFGWWFSELVDATVERFEQGDEPGWEASVWLLHGLAAQGADLPADLLHRARNAVRDRPGGLPEWVAGVPRIHATGEVRRLRDIYGTRFGVIAEYVFPGDASSGWYLWDIDGSGFVVLADAGVYDDAEQAADAWRARVGDADPTVAVIDDPADLRCLVELDAGDEISIRGDEPRRVMDNWFRADARIGDLARTLRNQGRPLPARVSLYHDVDVTVLTGPFADWHVRTLGGPPDPEVVEALAAEWMEGALPETWFSASPARIRFQRELIDDWIPDDRVTCGVIALLPEWVRWLGERSGLPADLMQPLLDAARETPRRPVDDLGWVAARGSAATT
jgi:hypothetical protein